MMRGMLLEVLPRMDTNPDAPTEPSPPPIEDPPSGREPVIDEPGRQVPAVDPRLPGQPRKIRDPKESPENPTGPGQAS